MSRISENSRWFAGEVVTAIRVVLPLFAVFCAFPIGLVMLRDPQADFASVTNSAFAGLATLSALAFSMSRCLTEADDRSLKESTVLAGTQFLSATILIVSVAIFRYLDRSLVVPNLGGTTLRIIFKYTSGLLSSVGFASSLAYALNGINLFSYAISDLQIKLVKARQGASTAEENSEP